MNIAPLKGRIRCDKPLKAHEMSVPVPERAPRCGGSGSRSAKRSRARSAERRSWLLQQGPPRLFSMSIGPCSRRPVLRPARGLARPLSPKNQARKDGS
jgi:hypothetical protein